MKWRNYVLNGIQLQILNYQVQFTTIQHRYQQGIQQQYQQYRYQYQLYTDLYSIFVTKFTNKIAKDNNNQKSLENSTVLSQVIQNQTIVIYEVYQIYQSCEEVDVLTPVIQEPNLNFGNGPQAINRTRRGNAWMCSSCGGSGIEAHITFSLNLVYKDKLYLIITQLTRARIRRRAGNSRSHSLNTLQHLNFKCKSVVYSVLTKKWTRVYHNQNITLIARVPKFRLDSKPEPELSDLGGTATNNSMLDQL
ncbi:Hypothetical_protein [Hexamita inflata]|uniref:Hypothetical_protein n=1 Tax=Hexamita inflata TaxID=28002 RepID=A0AA86R025_9EUKA|nr:Hypothetical protein HINF_LOCUS54763 [Hexamita inflata]